MGNLFHTSTSHVYWILGKYYDDIELDTKKRNRIIESFFRFTYRYNMPPLLPSVITSDCGWGCMLRAAQMIMAYTLKRHHLCEFNSHTSDEYCSIVECFIDYPGYPHLYSLHRMVECGLKYQMQPGQWYGPSTVSYILRDLAHAHCSHFGGTLQLLVTQGDTIYQSEVEELLCCLRSLENNTSSSNIVVFNNKEYNNLNSDNNKEYNNLNSDNNLTMLLASPDSDISLQQALQNFYDPLMHPPPDVSNNNNNNYNNTAITNSFIYSSDNPSSNSNNIKEYKDSSIECSDWNNNCGLMILIPLRLGINQVNEEYIEEIKEVLRDKQCIGIIGGKPNHALYFVGYTVPDNNYNNHNDINNNIEVVCDDTRLIGFDPHTAYANPPRPASYTSHQTTQINNNNNNNYNNNISMTNSLKSAKDKMNSSNFVNILNETSSLHTSISLSTNSKLSKKKKKTSNPNPSESSVKPSILFPSQEHKNQIHTSQYTTIDIRHLDPSLAIGLYFKNKKEFDDFCIKSKENEIRKIDLGLSPLFSIREKMPSYMNSNRKLNKSSIKTHHTDANTSSIVNKTKTDVSNMTKITKVESVDYCDVDENVSSSNPITATTIDNNKAKIHSTLPAATTTNNHSNSDDDYVLV